MFIFSHATFNDLPEILAIEQASFKNPWSQESLASELSDPLTNTIIVKTSPYTFIYGYSCYKIIPPEAELLRIAISPKSRRRGTARALLDEMFKLLRFKKVTTVFLEVSETNQAAINLYKKSGFSVTGRRSGYYDQGKTAALLLQKEI